MVSCGTIPGWFEVLLGEKFFNSCLVHESQKKNEENTFCLDCCVSLCLHCLPSHTNHRLLQIRRYVYQDVLRLKDAEKLMDCSFIQSYITNSAKVLFLKQRPMRRQMKGSGNSCIVCERNLQDPYLFCSIFCKVNYIVSNSRKQLLYKYECLVEVEGGGQFTPNSVLKTLFPLATSSGSSGSATCKILSTQSFNRKRSVMFQWPSECTSATSRRKNVPRRSPLS
ncbi:hypothetical protein Pfo_025570 [Paulownia fortunei]|nr:hypothetical protein Pfo_025570 [Paulownia fortunei]